MTESKGEAKSWRTLSYELEAKLTEFKRIQADPNIGMRHELPLMADLVEIIAEIERQLVLQMPDLP